MEIAKYKIAHDLTLKSYLYVPLSGGSDRKSVYHEI
jgi:hypothetical protein